MQNNAGFLAWAEAGADLRSNVMDNRELGLTLIAENLWLLRSGGRSKSPRDSLRNQSLDSS